MAPNRKRKRAEGEERGRDLKPKHLRPLHVRTNEKRLIIILEKAQLETTKNGPFFELLNCDDHVHVLKKLNRDPATCRPDITHQCLLMLLDSPLNRAGLLQVYIHTQKNVLIEIDPQTRIPRTFKRFAGLMVQLLYKFSIRASSSSKRLLRVIKNPVTDHLPVGCKKVSTSFSASNVIHPKDIVPDSEPIVIVVGAMAHGKLEPEYTEEEISISHYPLSAALTCTKLCSAFEEKWNVH